MKRKVYTLEFACSDGNKGKIQSESIGVVIKYVADFNWVDGQEEGIKGYKSILIYGYFWENIKEGWKSHEYTVDNGLWIKWGIEK